MPTKSKAFRDKLTADIKYIRKYLHRIFDTTEKSTRNVYIQINPTVWGYYHKPNKYWHVIMIALNMTKSGKYSTQELYDTIIHEFFHYMDTVYDKKTNHDFIHIASSEIAKVILKERRKRK
jgi:hypothetical protein